MWWFVQIILTLASVFFLVFGIDLVIGSYTLADPYSFIMTFFAASFIILISIALTASFIIKMIRVYRQIHRPEPDDLS